MSSGETQPTDPAQLPSTILNHRRVDLGLILLIGFAPLVLSGIYQLFIPLPATTDSTNLRFSAGLIHEAATLLLFVVLLRRQGRRLKDIGLGFQWLDVPKAIGLSLLSYIGFVFVSVTVRQVYFFWNREQIHYRDPQVIFAGASHVLLIVYIIAAPIFEETLVRGYLMTELIGFSCPVWLAAMASVVLQTSYHLYYGVGGALSVAVGFVISAAYFAKSRNLMPVILSHFVWDLTATYMNWHR